VSDTPVIALVGNPNCGKTTLFNALTGARQKVGNWPGVTVERRTGRFQHGEQSYEVVDLPGVYSLWAAAGSDSLDHEIAREYLVSDEPDLIVNIVDASSLERGLYLTSQLMDAGKRLVLALNMMDVADEKGVHIDPQELAGALGCPVVPLVASRREGIGILSDVVARSLERERPSPKGVRYDATLHAAMERVAAVWSDSADGAPKARTLALLEGDDHPLAALDPRQREQVKEVLAELDDSLDDRLIGARYAWVEEVVSSAVATTTVTRTYTDVLDGLFLSRFFAIPAFFAVMYLMFMVTINVGSAFIDFFDILAGAIFVETPRAALEWLGTPAVVVTLLADGLGGGVQLVASFIPIIGCLFLCLSFLEDSGYMARAAFVVDRGMSTIGLPGKSFVPLIVGFGCNVPAVMATRTLENHQDRLLTTIMAPFMSCGARLTVYALFAAAFFPRNGQNVVFGLYLIGIGVAVLSGLVIRRFMLSRETSPFIMELPSYHIPTLRALFMQTWHRLKGFVMRAGKAIVAVVVVLNFVNSIGTDFTFGNQNSEKSVLSAIGKELVPAFEPMGVKEENWPATVGIATGVFAKEVVVGTLDSLYGTMARAERREGRAEETSFDFIAQVQTAFSSVAENLADLGDALTDPLGIGIGDVSDVGAAAEAQEVEVTTITIMSRLFDGTLGAFSYLLFILLYVPCVATIGAIYKELGRFWAIFSATWSIVIAYVVAVSCYQIGTFGEHPLTSSLWVGTMLLIAGGCYGTLIVLGRRRVRDEHLIPVVNL
jgi:ferrous iron transport protein B